MEWAALYNLWRMGKSPRVDHLSAQDVGRIFDECSNPRFVRYVYAGTVQSLFLKYWRGQGHHI